MGNQFEVVGFGEMLWALLPEGPQFGDATANFARHASMLGADGFVISQVGNDELGEKVYRPRLMGPSPQPQSGDPLRAR
jgi:sugar/nucleoside kinase (ribokinase family)